MRAMHAAANRSGLTPHLRQQRVRRGELSQAAQRQRLDARDGVLRQRAAKHGHDVVLHQGLHHDAAGVLAVQESLRERRSNQHVGLEMVILAARALPLSVSTHGERVHELVARDLVRLEGLLHLLEAAADLGDRCEVRWHCFDSIGDQP